MSNKRVYVSGPMSGIKNYNWPEFAKAREALKNEGWEVITPHTMDATEGDNYYKERITGVWQSDKRGEYLRRDIQMLRDGEVGAVYMLKGWEASQGARLEHDVAVATGLKVLYEDAELAKKTSPKNDESILLEAHQIVHGERGAAYGHPLEDFGRTCGMLNALLKNKLKEPLVEEDVASMMVCVKLSRDMNKPNRDNLRDIAGYAETKQMVRDERQRRTLERERIEHEGAGGER